MPKQLVHDRDPRFTSQLWQELWTLLGTKTSASTAFHPQSDGQTERMNRTVEQVLRAHLLHDKHTSWLDALPYVEFAINSTINQSTGRAPFEMLYGTNIASPFDHATQTSHANISTDANAIAKHIQSIIISAQKAMQ